MSERLTRTQLARLLGMLGFDEISAYDAMTIAEWESLADAVCENRVSFDRRTLSLRPAD